METAIYFGIMIICMGAFIPIGLKLEILGDDNGDVLFVILASAIWPITILFGISACVTGWIIDKVEDK